ncbi:ABC transporter substrate-binding protein [Rickettsiales endosymbiont of Peranema trichophorum]|uniref:MlaC/ttg2D family ABC transporter substrate-binding protein n=1 Tax=Rickettsiales endosymbiont of Peranema trichophorum TaxID=2486577 RepID=UPI001022CD1F|nr:ABC transporter substrate-binding protein [Rickettsiales endosymbiont of Peranema trichophorum]RZI47467.1 ABC transporter substrate-binding protein [Rickettsiales endosymbiont of Peranema trichophorum]
MEKETKMRILQYLGLTCTLMIIPVALLFASDRPTLDRAQNFINNNAQNVLIILQSREQTPPPKERLSNLFLSIVDYDWIGKFALGKYWNDLSKEQQDKYYEVYKNYLCSVYVSKYTEYNKQTYKITDTRKMESEQYSVFMKIALPDRNDILDIAYRLRKDGDSFKIIDIMAEGVSLANTQRAEFTSFLSSHSFDDLLKSLESKVE